MQLGSQPPRDPERAIMHIHACLGVHQAIAGRAIPGAGGAGLRSMWPWILAEVVRYRVQL